MGNSLPIAEAGCHHRLADVQPRAVKADVRKTDDDGWRLAIAGVIVQVKGTLTLKEFAAAVDREPRLVARWMSAEQRPQFDAIFAVEQFRHPLIVALAQLAGSGVEVETVVRIRRVHK